MPTARAANLGAGGPGMLEMGKFDMGTIAPDRFLQTLRSAMAQSIASPQKLMEINLEAGGEFLAILGRCLAAQANLCQEIAHIEGPDRLVEVQRRCVECMARDYAEEMSRLAELAQSTFGKYASLFTEMSAMPRPDPAAKGSERAAMAMPVGGT
ncbi:MAG TPA: hypothetical protein VFR34_13825 [Paracoccaceae bacterium]|nr:hypothetical protein [Paracoccaceae bacterium]